MGLKTRDNYLAALKELRPNIYKFGELIEDVTTHPATKRTVESHALNYDAANDSELADMYTATSIFTSKKILRWNSMMGSSDDLIANMRMKRQNYRRTGSCTGAVCVGWNAQNVLWAVTQEIDNERKLMNSRTHLDITTHIVEKAKAFGASLAGIASIAPLKNSPSYEIYHRSPYYEGYEKVEWPMDAKSVLVLALVHKPSEPELDWWDYRPGRTPGNRRLISIAKSLEQWMNKEFSINARPLPYRVEQGGILLKDAAVLAGLGTIGKNNLLITPQFGPRVRFKAMFLDVDLEPTGPIDFTPCEACDMPCRRVCPQEAFRNSSYSRALCDLQMGEDVANEVIVENWEDDGSPGKVRKYCRACELACPVAR